jgi:hypothetical protein
VIEGTDKKRNTFFSPAIMIISAFGMGKYFMALMMMEAER